MNYLLLVITLLTLVLVFLTMWFIGHDTKIIYQNLEENREVDKIRDDLFLQGIKRTNDIASGIVKTQKSLDKKMSVLSRFVDDQNAYVNFQHEQFTSLAKSDMLAARRDELIRTKELKVALERIMGMAMTSRQEPSVIDKLAMESVINRIEELETILANNSGGL